MIFPVSDAKDMKYKILADRVRYFKEDEKGVATMCRAMEEMRMKLHVKQNMQKQLKLQKVCCSLVNYI